MAINNNEREEIASKLMDGWATQVRGDDPQDYQNKCLELCQTFLGSDWLELGFKDIERLTGGMTNQIYRCKALTTNGVEDNETPNEAVIRFYGEKYDLKTCPKGSRLYDGLIAWIASNEGFGPKVYGLFENGQMLKYYKHRYMNEEDMLNQVTRSNLAQILAKFHSLRPPINKDADWLTNYLNSNVDQLVDVVLNRNKLEKYDCKALLDLDFKKEIQWLTELMAGYDSPIVFSHNDFRFGNILMTDNNDIVLTDFDYSVYGFRGFDFATLFGCNYDNLEDLFSDNDSSIVRQFIASYVKHSERIYGNDWSQNSVNSVQHIHQEFKLSLPYFFMFSAKTLAEYQDDFFTDDKEAKGVINHLIVQYNTSKMLLSKYEII